MNAYKPNNSKLGLIKKRLTRIYGFEPRVTVYNGKIYVSDPRRPSEPWHVWEDETEAWEKMNKWGDDLYNNH